MSKTAPLWTAAQAAAATQGTNFGDWSAFGVSIDSRAIAKGDLFIAISGPQFDGHDYAADALANGAACVVVHKRPANLADDAPTLTVANTTQALIDLGIAARARSAARVVAVTGSVGKTGIKDALHMALARQAPTHATTGNLNNEYGLPLTLARMPVATQYAVLEMGMSHPGELTELSEMARPHVALISTIAAAHSEFFDTLNAIADAKAEIFAGLQAGGTTILNHDIAQYNRLYAAARKAGVAHIIGFGTDANAEVRANKVTADPTGTDIEAMLNGSPMHYRIGIPGAHWVNNSLAVLAAVDALGADVAKAALALADAQAPAGRGARHQLSIGTATFTLIDESYNANPSSMNAALALLRDTPPARAGRRIAVLGDMLELGSEAEALHLALAEPIADAKTDLVFTTGPNMATLNAALPTHCRAAHAANPPDLATAIIAAVGDGDVVMVKGSAGSQTGLIVRALTQTSNSTDAANGVPIAC